MDFTSQFFIEATLHIYQQQTMPSLIQIMTNCLFGTKPLPKSVLVYCSLNAKEQISVKFKSKQGENFAENSSHFVLFPIW